MSYVDIRRSTLFTLLELSKKLINEKGVEVDDEVQKEMEEAIQQNGQHIQSLLLSDFQPVFFYGISRYIQLMLIICLQSHNFLT